ncbi:MAG TPA: prepilin-type N-terminal cleavage/methylation domain-containing protein [Rubrobacter sp.]|nr:prepilin-type N-terminal cleavage/methylation domain-containing protein [Rubrobacter sp.]
MTSLIRRTGQCGYSLVEVMVAIVVLTVAIIPMVGMFEAAIRAANTSGDYDEARTCAVQKLEQVKNLPSETVENGLRDGVCEPSGFGYTVDAQPIGTDLGDGSGDEGLTRITVTVNWGGGNSYNVAGVVSRW